MDLQNIKKYSQAHPIIFTSVATACIFLMSVLLELAVKSLPPFVLFDRFFYLHINGLPHTQGIDQLLFPFGLWFLPWKMFFMPAYFYFLFFPFFIYLYLKKPKMFVRTLATLILALVLAGVLYIADNTLIFRPRPFTQLPAQHVSAIARSILPRVTSFPSGHTRDTTITAVVMSSVVPELTIPMTIFTLFIAFTRVYAGEHYPTDVLGGLLQGLCIAKIAIFVVIQKHHDKKHATKTI